MVEILQFCVPQRVFLEQILFNKVRCMIAAIRVVTHPDGVTTSRYKYLPTAAHITLMAFITLPFSIKVPIILNL